MPVIQLPPEINNHKEEWVALSHDNLMVGHGRTPEACIASAKAEGFEDLMSFSLLWVPDQWPGVIIGTQTEKA